MSVMATGIQVIEMEDLAGEFALPCEYGEDSRHEHESAEWIMFLTPCCTETVRVRLACDICKTERLSSKYTAVECEDCGEVTAPARKAYVRSEAL